MTDLPRPLRPGVVPRTRTRRLGQEFEVCDGLRAMPHRSADAVVAGITTTDDDDVFSSRADIVAILEVGVQK